jgi:uridine kinase
MALSPNCPSHLEAARDAIVVRVRQLSAGRTRPLLIAIDGRSGTGKSTLATLVAEALGAALIRSDDFYAAHIPDAAWDRFSAAEKVARAIDWPRLRAEALEPLLRGQPAVWHPFDFAYPRPDGTYPRKREPDRCEPAGVIVVEGAYAARPELEDLIDLSILVEAPEAVRCERLAAREDPDFLRAWHARWDEAEAFYFTQVRPRSAFDVAVDN